MGAIFVLAGLAQLLLANNSKLVGIVMLVCGVIIIGQGLGIVPMRRPRR
jgi:threonine/homoserine/homoserine lactone efflux protein